MQKATTAQSYKKIKKPKKIITVLKILHEIRCPHCNKLLGKFGGIYEIKCQRCKHIIEGKAG